MATVAVDEPEMVNAVNDFIECLYNETKYMPRSNSRGHRIKIHDRLFDVNYNPAERVFDVYVVDKVTNVRILHDEPNYEEVIETFGLVRDDEQKFRPRFKHESYWRTTCYAGSVPDGWRDLPIVNNGGFDKGPTRYEVRLVRGVNVPSGFGKVGNRYGIAFTTKPGTSFQGTVIIDPELPPEKMTISRRIVYREVEWHTIKIWNSPFK